MSDTYHSDLMQLLDTAIFSQDKTPLEDYLRLYAKTESEFDPELLDAFSIAVGRLCITDNPPVDALESLLDGWAALDSNHDAILVAAAASAYGRVAVVRPDWWDDEIRKLHTLAADQRESVIAAVERALRLMLNAELIDKLWQHTDSHGDRTLAALDDWTREADPRVSAFARRVIESWQAGQSGQDQV